MISQGSIEEIKSHIDIVDVVSDFVSLKKSGSNYKALSPFTNEKTPSFFVSPSKEIYKCFSSGKGGDAINFIMEIEGISYVEALRYLAKKYGITLEEEEGRPEDLERQSERESIFIVLNFARDYFIKMLWENEEGQAIGLSYLMDRGFNEPIIRKFELGYSLNAWDGLMKTALEAGYTEEILEKAGLIIKNQERTYDRFRGRIIFPIHNTAGKSIAFGARILSGDKNQPKYINSPETPIYHKSSILYGIHQARQAIRQDDNCYLVEGYTDVISMHLSGVANVVGSSGTALTTEQIKLVKRYTDNITVLFDGDTAGIKASLRGIDMILEAGLNVRSLIFPDNEDPDSYARKLGTKDFHDFLTRNRKDFITFKANLYAADAARDPIKKAESIREIISSIAKVPDAVKQAVYIRETSSLIEMEESILYNELKKILLTEKKRPLKKNDPPEVNYVTKTPKQSTILGTDEIIRESIRMQERESIRLLISYGHNKMEEEHKLYEFMLKELSDVEFQTPIYDKILGIFKDNLAKGRVIDADYLIKNGPDDVKKEIIDLIEMRYDISENWSKKNIHVPHEEDMLNQFALQNIIRLKHRVVLKLIEDNQREINKLSDEGQIQELQKVIIELNKLKTELARKLGLTVI